MKDLERTAQRALDVTNVRTKFDIGRVKDLQDSWEDVGRRLDYRLAVAKMYFDFHRHRQLVSNAQLFVAVLCIIKNHDLEPET